MRAARLARSGLLADDPRPAWELLPAEQQPGWREHSAYACTRSSLRRAAPLVSYAEVSELHSALAAVASGQALLLQMGDCAESLAEQTPAHLAAKVGHLTTLADLLADQCGQPVVRVGRIGGQFAKPRSVPVEWHADGELPAFRGHMVNSEDPTTPARQHDPRRMLLVHAAAAQVNDWLRTTRYQALADSSVPQAARGPWSSHEALVLDYEGPLVRPAPGGGAYLSSTHFPWVGERTRLMPSAHVALLAAVRNPVACKVGPAARPVDVVRLCEVLDPERVPGRLSLILRFGRSHVAQAMPDVVDAVQRAGHPVVWCCDPMHGNTVVSAHGVKTRYLQDIAAEVSQFLRVLRDRGLHAGGLHLETAADDVTECVGGNVLAEGGLLSRYQSLCDPRLNPQQAHQLIAEVFA